MAQEITEMGDCHMDFSDLDDAQLLDRLMMAQAAIREAGEVADEIVAEIGRRMVTAKAA